MSDPQAQAATALWRFSLAVYRRAGVAPECLDVQERFGVDVNLLLFCAYLGALEAVVLSKDDLGQAAAVVRGWHGEIVRTLAPGEPQWLESDRQEAIALVEVEAGTCQGCGQPRDESTSLELEFGYEATVIRCHACATALKSARAFQAGHVHDGTVNADALDGLTFHVSKKT